MVIAMPEDVIHRHHFAYEPVCGVLAVAVAAGVRFIDAYKYIGKKKRLNWKGATTTSEQLDALKHFGCKYESVNLKEYGVNYYFGQRKSLLKFVGLTQLKMPKEILLVKTRNHAQIVQGSYVIDQSGKVHISKYHFKKRNVITVYRIINPNFDESKVPDIVKETIEMTARENTKTTRAFEIFNRETRNGKKRKEILAIMTEELETSWGSASTFYHKAKKHFQTETVSQTPASEEVKTRELETAE